jgi:tRNA pseudouridine13 synthase
MRLKTRPDDFRVDEVLRLPPPDRAGPFAIFRLRKRGLSTFQAASRIAALFRVPPRDVHFAGLKDKRAAAAQLVSVKLGAREVPAVPPERGLALELVHRAARSIAGEDILANRFAIVARDLAPEDVAPLAARIEVVRREGIPNYFDDQRLGGASPERGFVAKLLSEGRLEDALRLAIARPSPKDPREERLAKKLVAEKWGRWGELAREVRGESLPIVRRLANDPADLAGAFRGLDVRLRALLVSQYQSWLWNEEAAALLRREVARERRFEIMYRGGTLVFWRGLEEAERAALAARELPFAAFPLPPALGVRVSRGARRLALVPAALEAGADEPDDAFPGRRKVLLRIELPRGAYATLVAKRLFYEP